MLSMRRAIALLVFAALLDACAGQQCDFHSQCGDRFYCEFGRCGQDCRRDIDCAAGQVCSEIGRCGAPFETREHKRVLEVTRLSGEADGQVLPGDRIVDIEGDPEASLPYRLAGPPGSSVRVLVERPDESRAWVAITRERCERCER